MECKGICGRYKANRPRSCGWRYTTGQKRCKVCDIYINWRGKDVHVVEINLEVVPKRQSKKKMNL